MVGWYNIDRLVLYVPKVALNWVLCFGFSKILTLAQILYQEMELSIVDP